MKILHGIIVIFFLICTTQCYPNYNFDEMVEIPRNVLNSKLIPLLSLHRVKRQPQNGQRFGGNNFDNDDDDDDEWYVFDEVEEDNAPSRSQNNNQQNFNRPNDFNQQSFNRPNFNQQPNFDQQNFNQQNFDQQNFNQRPFFNQQNNNFRNPTQSVPQNNWGLRPTSPIVLPNSPPRLPPCEENCQARATSEYNPVCGTNMITYNNMARFECAKRCGNNVNIRMMGRCGPILPLF